jgi:hypothetical protein
MLIKFQVLIILAMVAPCVSYAKEIHVQGSVFRDENQNGTQDLNESGIGGIELSLNRDHFRTNEDGKFSHTINVEDEFSTLFINEEKLPAGSRLTSAPSFIITKSKLNFSNASFGIWFPSEKTQYPKSQDSKVQSSTQKGFQFRVSDHKLYLNDVPAVKFSPSLKSSTTEDVKLELNEKGELADEKKFQAFIEKLQKKLVQNEITEFTLKASRPLKNVEETEELDDLAQKYSAQLKKLLPLKTINRELGFKGSYIEILARLGIRSPEKCRLYYGAMTFEVEKNKPYFLSIGSKDKVILEAQCPGKNSKIEIQVMDENFIAQVENKSLGGSVVFSDSGTSKAAQDISNQGELVIEQNRYLEKNRDQYAQFWLTSHNLKSYTINGRTFRPSTIPQHYLHAGKSGDNKLNISMTDRDGVERVAKHEFSLFQQRKFYFSTTLDSYDLRSRSSKFNFNYDIPTQKRTNTEVLYFYHENWGLRFNHVRDISKQTTELAGGGSESYQRTDTQIHSAYRFKVFHSGYFAPVLHLYAGLEIKDSGLPKNSILHFPKKFQGLSLGGELLKENFFTTQVASSTALFLGYKNSDNRTIRLTQEFRVNLNRMGQLFSAQKEYIYGPTYRGWNNVRLVFGINYEADEREAENVTAKISDKTIAYRLGLAIQI